MGAWYESFTLIECMHVIHRLTNDFHQIYQLYDWGHDQSLMIRPEADDDDSSCECCLPPNPSFLPQCRQELQANTLFSLRKS